MKKNNPVLELSFRFALDIIEFSEKLDDSRKFILSRQIFRSGTSIGASIREAQSSESKPDFIHKMKIASKEAEETEYWLLLCKYSPGYPKNEMLLDKVKELLKLLSSIIFSAKKSLPH
jgi:four helix bundle protein